MIKPQELRIGNYVFDIDGDVLQVGEILDIGVKFKGTSLSSRYEKINPIPLTEEILLKFGFEKREHKSFFKGKELIYFTFTSNKYGFLIWNTIQNQWWVLGKISISQPIYVHQLQNLYFALTGEELIFKKD